MYANACQQQVIAIVAIQGVLTLLAIDVVRIIATVNSVVAKAAEQNIFTRLAVLLGGTGSSRARDLVLRRSARKVKTPEILWDVDDWAEAPAKSTPLRAAE